MIFLLPYGGYWASSISSSGSSSPTSKSEEAENGLQPSCRKKEKKIAHLMERHLKAKCSQHLLEDRDVGSH